MSVKVLSYVWEFSQHKGSELVTLLAIADHADDDGTAYPSIQTLAQKSRMTERNVQHVLKKLEHSKELHIQLGQGLHGRHVFQILMPGVKSFQGEKFSGVKSFQVKSSVKTPAPSNVSPSQTLPLLTPQAREPSVKNTPLSFSDEKTPGNPRRNCVEKLSPEELIALYNDSIPYGHPQVRKVTEDRRKKASKYLKQFPKRAFWEVVFAEIHASQLLQGRVKNDGHGNFIGDFDWLLTRGKDGTENCIKVAEGKYNDDTTKRTGLVMNRSTGVHAWHPIYIAGEAPLCVTCQCPLPEGPDYAEVYEQFRQYQSYIVTLA